MIVNVCGPPCAGKSHYVATHMGAQDAVFDYDHILTAMTGRTLHSAQAPHPIHEAVIAVRELMISHEALVDTLWVISCDPLSIDGAVIHPINATRDECLTRLAVDDSRADKIAWKAIIDKYFAKRGENNMQIEIRGDGVRISGYANVVERCSRPVMTPRGKVIEEILPGAFDRALSRAENVTMTKDHISDTVVAETRAGTLRLYEDAIGLHYDADISDLETVEEARSGKIKGLSFGMRNIKDQIEERVDSLPLRKISDLDLDHITLVVHKSPAYSATSVELRADQEVDVETRAVNQTPQVVQPEQPAYDNSAYRQRADALKTYKNNNGGTK